MGHLINALAFRLGWTNSWLDSWYSNYIYYSEYLYSVLRMRLFLIYFFSSKKFIKHGFLYSHFEIYSKDNTVSLNIFYYDRNLLLLFESFYETFTEGAAGLYLQEPIKFKYSDFWYIIVFLSYLLNFFFNSTNYIVYYRLLFFVFAFKKVSLEKVYYDTEFDEPIASFLNKRTSFIMLFITIFRNVYSLLLYARQNRINAIYDTSFRFFTGISLYHWNYDLFKHIGIFFSFFFKHFTSFYKFNTNFYVLSNSSLTASFISKYIAVQLVRGQDVRDILATLRLEFNQIRDYTSEPFPMHYIKRLIIYKTYRNSIKKKKFKKFTVNLIYFSNRQNRNYFQSTKTWFVLETLLTLSWTYFSGPTLDFLVNFSVSYSLSCIFLYFFFKNGYYFLTKFMNLMDSFQTSIYFLNINFVFSFLFSNFNFALFNYFFDRINLSFLKLVNLSLKKYLNYRYFSYSAFINISYVGLNFKKMRDLRELGVRGANSLIGFKMLCLGRFSRKQRVRKIFYSDFKMPLSKISADIDYNFRVVPLLNSATSIKVWIYKRSDHPEFHFKLN